MPYNHKKVKTIIFAFFGVMVALSSCRNKAERHSVHTDSTFVHHPPIQVEKFGKLPDGRTVNRYTLLNKHGLKMQVINYGGIITSLSVPDKNGNIEDVVLGYDSLADYMKEFPYFGALIGRYGNRIQSGKFKLDGKEYSLAKNNNGHHLHGGLKGFDKVYWEIEEVKDTLGPSLKLSYTSPDGEEGYPGNLQVDVRYTLTNADELKIQYQATTDRKTVVNLTQHSYFNLSGNSKQDILEQCLTLHANQFLPVNEFLIPTGELKNVLGTPFDFSNSKKVGEQINQKDQQLTNGLGYDHCWVLSSKDSLKFAASLYDSASGRLMKVYTTEPAIQFYSGNFLDGSLTGKGGIKYMHRYGLCLETQHFPDSPNKAHFPSVILNDGETYKSTTIYTFRTAN